MNEPVFPNNIHIVMKMKLYLEKKLAATEKVAVALDKVHVQRMVIAIKYMDWNVLLEMDKNQFRG